MKHLPVKWNPKKARALEMLVMCPSMSQAEIANEVTVSRNTIHQWLRDPEFVEVFYEKYMVTFGAKLPSVLQSMIREAESGNVQAGRLVLEHSGKLIKRVEVQKHQSPFEKFLINSDAIEDAEFEVFPQRPFVPEKEIPVTKSIMAHEEKKKKQKAQKRKEALNWRMRALKAGVEILPKGRKTPRQKQEWQKKVLEAEKAKNTQSNVKECP